MDENYKKGSVTELVYEIFTKDNLENFQLLFDNANDPKELFTLLLEIFRKGMKLLYSNDEGVVDLDTMTMEQFYEVKQKFEQLGFKIEFEKVERQVQQNNTDEQKEQSIEDVYYSGLGPDEEGDHIEFNLDSDSDSDSDGSELPPIGEYISHDIETIPVEEEDTLKDLFFTLKTDHFNYKLWFDFL